MSLRAAFLFVSCALAGASQASEVPLLFDFGDGFELPASSLYRLGQLQLRDPHVFVPVPLGGTTLCTDATDLPSVGLNAQIAANLAADSNSDGQLDTSPLLLFRPLDNGARPGVTTSTTGSCSVATPRVCSVDTGPAASVRRHGVFDLSATPTVHCLEPLAGTTSSWGSGAPVPQPGGICYASSAADIVLDTGAADIPLLGTAFAAPLPAATGSTGGGLMRGFLRAADAATIMVDINGSSRSLASLLPGGAGSCKPDVAGGVDTRNGESGWWFYFEYRQDAVSQ